MKFDHHLPRKDENQILDKKLSSLFQDLQGKQRRLIGYPCNNNIDYSELYPFLGMSINNVGDPFSKSSYHLNTREIEQDLIYKFARLMNGDVEETWGYVTNGGTEGNLYGLFLARELYPKGIVYYSEDTHYSVSKLIRLLGVKSIMLRSDDKGQLDLEDFEATLTLNRDVPAIVVANVGTTMTGAVDDIEGIRRICKNLVINDLYIHADCALSGMILPFVDEPQAFNFADGVHSMSISGHKFIGSPIPCGIVLAQKSNVERISRAIEYVGTLDTTITGSRNGISPLFLWYAWQKQGFSGFKVQVEECLSKAQWATDKMNALGIPAWRHKNSITVVFERPSACVIEKWSLAVEDNKAHLITMQHVDQEMILDLINDIVAGKEMKA